MAVRDTSTPTSSQMYEWSVLPLHFDLPFFFWKIAPCFGPGALVNSLFSLRGALVFHVFSTIMDVVVPWKCTVYADFVMY